MLAKWTLRIFAKNGKPLKAVVNIDVD